MEMFASDLRPRINHGFVVAGKYRMHVHRVWRILQNSKPGETWVTCAACKMCAHEECTPKEGDACLCAVCGEDLTVVS